MIDYRPWLDSTNGIRPEKTAESFNNIVYLVGMVVGLKFHKYEFPTAILDLSQEEDLFEDHCIQNADENGLYKPKNSHDNLTMKMCGSIILGSRQHKWMNLFHACKGANFHPRDVILYCYLLGNPIVRFIASFFLLIPALSILVAAYTEGKIRPKGYLLDMIKNRPLLLAKYGTKDGWVKDYKYKDGSTKSYRLHQNDGKILSVYRLLTTCRTSLLMRLTAKIFEYRMVKEYGECYMSQLYYRYFPEGYNHPTTESWIYIKTPLKKVMELK